MVIEFPYKPPYPMGGTDPDPDEFRYYCRVCHRVTAHREHNDKTVKCKECGTTWEELKMEEL